MVGQLPEVADIVQWAKTHTVTSTLLVATFVFFFLRWMLTRRKNFPPGPWGLPVIGYVPLLSGEPFRRLDDLSKKYGDVFSLSLGGRPTVVLNSFSAMKEALSNPVYLGRPPDSLFEIIKEPGSPPAPDVPEWMKIRRFTLHLLRDLGFGKPRVEELMKEEVMQFLREVKDQDGRPICSRMFLAPSVTNNICALIFGKRFERGHKAMEPFTQTPESTTNIFNMVGILMFIPFAKTIVQLILRFSGHAQPLRLLEDLVKSEIDLHKKSFDFSSSPNDYVDGYLQEMEKCKEDESNVVFTEPFLSENVTGLLGAGSDTTATSLEWCCLVMAAYPEIQKRVQKEIDEIVGKERLPCWSDHTRLPYTQAVQMEVMRWVTILPINVPRYTLEDSKLRGFDIPKGTTVIVNMWAIHHDPAGWKDPETFLPERFLSADGKTVVKPENYIPFSYGKRSCLGEPLAVQEVFLYFTAIMQTFSVQLPEGVQANFEGNLSITYIPKKHNLCFVPRDENRPIM